MLVVLEVVRRTAAPRGRQGSDGRGEGGRARLMRQLIHARLIAPARTRQIGRGVGEGRRQIVDLRLNHGHRRDFRFFNRGRRETRCHSDNS